MCPPAAVNLATELQKYASPISKTAYSTVHKDHFMSESLTRKNRELYWKHVSREARLKKVVLYGNKCFRRHYNGSNLDPKVGETREQELAKSDDFFKPVLDEGVQFVHHDGGQESAQGIFRRRRGKAAYRHCCGY